MAVKLLARVIRGGGCLATLVIAALLGPANIAGAAIVKIAQSGDPAPGVPGRFFGTFGFSEAPTLTADGRVAFAALLNDPNGAGVNLGGVWLGTAADLTLAAQAGTPAPQSPGVTYKGFISPVLSSGGRVGIYAQTSEGTNTDAQGIWSGAPGSVGLVAKINTTAPGTAALYSRFTPTTTPAMNSGGQLAFRAATAPADNPGIWTGTPGNVSLFAGQGVDAPGMPAGSKFFILSAPTINSAGTIAFSGVAGKQGIWAGPQGNLSLALSSDSVAPGTEAGLKFSNFDDGTVRINDAGQMAFSATTFTAGVGSKRGLWAGTPANLVLAARHGNPAPGTPANVLFDLNSTFGAPGINASGQVAFGSRVSGPGVDFTNDQGLWAGPAASPVLIAREGDLAPEAGPGLKFLGVTLNGFPPTPNFAPGGQVAFQASLTSIGSADESIWLADQRGERVLIGRRDAPLEIAPGVFRTASGFALTNGSGGEDGRASGVNAYGQVAFAAQYTNPSGSGIFVYTPALHWRTTGSGLDSWNNAEKWTLTLPPALVHDVSIDPATNVTVTGPIADTTVKSLKVGGGAGTTNLVLQTGVKLTATSGVQVAGNGRITGSGSLSTNAISTVAGPGSPTSEISSPLVLASPLSIDVVANSPLTISGPIDNSQAKTITRSNAGTLTVSGPQTHAAGAVFDAAQGVTNFNSDGGSNLTVRVGATVNFAVSQHLAALDVAAGGVATILAGNNKVLATRSLAVDPAGKLNLADNGMIVDYTGATPLATVRQQIIAGYGPGKDWTGPTGIGSSLGTSNGLAVGIAEASDFGLITFGGQIVDNTTLVLRLTRYGDANLDGTTDSSDLGRLLQNYNKSGGWAKGDGNYDGFVDSIDLGLLLNNFSKTVPVLNGLQSNLTAAVPEPASLVFFSFGLIGLVALAGQRRKRHCP